MADSVKAPQTSHLPVMAAKTNHGTRSFQGFAAIQRQVEANWDESLEMPRYSPVMANRAAANLLGVSAPQATPAKISSAPASGPTIQRACADCAEEQKADEEQATIQTKLAIGQPGDQYEQEADRVAQQVVNHLHAPQPQTSSLTSLSVVHPQSLPDKPAVPDITLMRQSADTAAAASEDVEDRIQRSRGQGQPLGDAVRAPMEQAFDADFSGVRIHTDGESHALNQAVQAKAFTTGQDIYFRSGAYEPGSRGGQELLAHELTHVVQQKQSLDVNRKQLVINRKKDVEKVASQLSLENKQPKDLDNNEAQLIGQGVLQTIGYERLITMATEAGLIETSSKEPRNTDVQAKFFEAENRIFRQAASATFWGTFGRYAAAAGVTSQVDSPAPGPADLVALGILAVGLAHAGYTTLMSSHGNQADTGIVNEAQNLIDAGKVATICAALELLMKAAKVAGDKARIQKIKKTQKAKGCRHSRHS